jgi:DNA-nicking Smr family endonuclease
MDQENHMQKEAELKKKETERMGTKVICEEEERPLRLRLDLHPTVQGEAKSDSFSLLAQC